MAMLIDCDRCVVREESCDDCVVTALLDLPRVDESVGAADLDGAERRALAVLAGSGLVPPLRLVPESDSGAGPRRVGPGPVSVDPAVGPGADDWRAVG
jgi:hypothetical protein